MEGYSDSVDLYKESLNQAGISNKKFDLYAQGTEAQLNKLKNAMSEVFSTSFNSETIRDIIGGLTSLTNSLNVFIDKLGLLPALAVAGIAAITTFSSKARQNLSSILGSVQIANRVDWNKGQQGPQPPANLQGSLTAQIPIWEKLKTLANDYNKRLQQTKTQQQQLGANGMYQSLYNHWLTLKGSVDKYTLSLKAAKIATIGLQTATALIGTVAFSMAIGWVFKLTDSFIHAKEKEQELFESLKNDVSTLSSELSESQKLAEQYKNLSNGAAKTAEEKEKLKRVTEQLSQLYPGIISQYDAEGNAVELSTEKLNEYIRVKEKELELKRQEMSAKFYENGDENVNTINNNINKIESLTKKIAKLEEKKNAYIEMGQGNQGNSAYVDIVKDISNAREELSKLEGESKTAFDTFSNGLKSVLQGEKGFKNLKPQELDDLVDTLLHSKDIYKEIENIGTGAFSKKIIDSGYIDQYNKINEQFNNLRENADRSEKDIENFNKSAINGFIKLHINMGVVPSEAKKIAEEFVKTNYTIKETSNIIDQTSTSLSELQKSLSDSASKIKNIKSALKAFNEDGHFNTDEIISLSEEYPQLLEMLGNEKAIREELNKLLDEEQTTIEKNYLEKMEQSESFYKNSILTNINLIKTFAKNYDIDLKNFSKLADLKKAVEKKMLSDMLDDWKKYFDATTGATTAYYKAMQQDYNLDFSGMGGMDVKRKAEYEKVADVLYQIEKAKKEVDKIISNAFVFPELGDTGKGKEKEEKAVNSLREAYEALDLAIKKVQNERDKLNAGTQEYRDLLQKENDLNKQKLELIKEEVKQLENLQRTKKKDKVLVPTSTSKAKGVIDIAMSALGTPYQWGGNDLKIGVDCSGLVQQSYKTVGVSVPRVAQDQYNSAPTKLTKEQLKPGDLVFFGSNTGNITHTGIYLGDGKMIEAPRTGLNVRISDAFSGRNFVGGGRYVAPTEMAELNEDSITDKLLSKYSEMLDLEKKIYEVGKQYIEDVVLEKDNNIQKAINEYSLLNSKLQLYEKGTDEYNKVLNEQYNSIEKVLHAMKEKELYLKTELQNESLSIEQKKQLKDALDDVTKAMIEQQITMKNLMDTAKSELESTADEIINIYKDIYQKQKDLKLKAIEEEIKAEEERSKRIIDNLDKELDKYQEIINAKLELIDKTEDEEDYNKQLAKLQKERQNILSQINTLSMDNSLEARNKVFELNEELVKKEEEIEEFKHDREVKLRKENLQDQLENYKKDIEKKKETENKKLESVKNELEKEKEYWTRHYDNLINDERKFAQIREDILNGHFGNISKDFEQFSKFVKDNMKDIGESISQNLIDKMSDAEKSLRNNYDNYKNAKEDYEKAKDTVEKETNPGSGNIKGKTFKGTQHTYYVDENGGIYKNDRYLALTSEQVKALEQDPAGSDALSYARWVKANKKHDGGFVNNTKAPNKISELVHKLFNTKGNEQLTLALQDEFFTPQKNIMQNFIPNMKNFASSIIQPNIKTGGGVINIQDFIRIDKIEQGANLDINKIADQAFDRFVQKLKPYGFLPGRV